MRNAILLSAVLCLMLAPLAAAGDSCTKPECCAEDCGCSKSCSKCFTGYCRVVCGTKEIKRTVWVVECEPFCVTNPGCCRDCKKSCCCDDGCCGPPPVCGKLRCRKKLVKKEIKCTVPIYKCVPVPCGCCEDPCGCDAPRAKPEQTQQAFDPAPLPPM